MRKLIVIAALLMAASVNARDVICLNRDWQFKNDTTEWRTVHLPHDFQIEQPWVAPARSEKADESDAAANVRSRLSARGFKEMGQGTYRKTLTVPDSLQGKRILLDFEGIMLYGDVWLNGEHVGKTDYGYVGFEIDVTRKLKFGEPNEIVVVANTGEPLNSRWYTGGGLYRDVNLVATAPDMYFNRHGLYITTPEVSADKAIVKIVGDINAGKPNNEMKADITITGPEGSVIKHMVCDVPVRAKWRNTEYEIAQIEIENPALWDCETPNLYTAQVRLLRADGSEADKSIRRFGIRSIEYSPDFGLKLNGKKVLLKGIANHHTLGALGAAAYPRAIEKRLQLLKDFGFNHIRTSHNPYSEEFMDLCDQYGFLVVDEVYDKWLAQYVGGRADFASLWQYDIPEWVRRDRSHPSVVMWSLGNELQGYSNLPFNDWGVTAYKMMKPVLNRYDQTRPVTVAMHPRVRSLDTDSIPAPLALETDIASYNYRYMYFPGDSKRYPNMIFYQSEANLTDMGPNFYKPDNSKVVGLAYWGMIDYLGESMGWPAKGWNNGVFDISLQPKPNAWFLKAMFTDEPVVRIGVVSPNSRVVDWNGVAIGNEMVHDNWNNPGDSVKLYTYTNADEVRLLINGKEVGRQANDKSNPSRRSRIVWPNVKWQPGTVEAVAYSDGKVVARHKLETTGKPVRLVVEPDNDEWTADGMDLQHVRVYAVDKKGRRVPVADDELRFSIDGDAQIVAVSNGDITSDELNVQTHRKLYQGAALAIIRSGVTPGEVSLTVEADNYRPVTLKMNTK